MRMDEAMTPEPTPTSQKGFTGLNPILVEHFLHPKNTGEIQDADGVGSAGDSSCGDHVRYWIKVVDDRISDIKFKCRGCPAAIACASVVGELALGKDLDEACEITDEMISEALGGLPAHKMHCSNMAADALYNAVMDHVVNWIDRFNDTGRPPGAR